MEIAPGIHRLGPGIVNCYLLEEQGGVTIIDAGAPGYWDDLPRELAAMGRRIDDVKALVLTHAHLDHIGFAERLRRERGVPVHVHAADVPLTRKAVIPKFKGKIRFAVLRFIGFAITHGMLRNPPPILEVATFADGETIDVPGRPRALHVPGHSEGSAALLVAARDAVFIGDAIVTLDVFSGETGPRLSPFNADRRRAFESLARLEGMSARLVLPGHGQPYTGGLPQAVRLARQGGPPS